MRTTMVGRVSIRRKLGSALAIYRAHRNGDFSNAEREVAFCQMLVDAFRECTGREIQGARVLDVGCGQTATHSLILASRGAEVTGIDIEVPTLTMGPRTFVRVARRNGLERALKSLARHVLFDRRFFRDLAAATGKPVRPKGVDLRVMDVKQMSFPDSTFDLIFAPNVFEHIDDLPPAVAEVNRVLKPGGIAVITPHLFPSLSGGHNLEWHYPMTKGSEDVPAWDHLREWRFPANTYLNGLKLTDYRTAFSAMDVAREDLGTEGGEAYLTPEIWQELAGKGYSREDLLTCTATFYARKRT
jgi:ubiquinone/menaquinone biosynthesis C-methylase UbiE